MLRTRAIGALATTGRGERAHWVVPIASAYACTEEREGSSSKPVPAWPEWGACRVRTEKQAEKMAATSQRLARRTSTPRPSWLINKSLGSVHLLEAPLGSWFLARQVRLGRVCSPARPPVGVNKFEKARRCCRRGAASELLEWERRSAALFAPLAHTHTAGSCRRTGTSATNSVLPGAICIWLAAEQLCQKRPLALLLPIVSTIARHYRAPFLTVKFLSNSQAQ